MVIKQLQFNKTPLANRKIEYIVLHDTGNKSKGADAEANFNYFNTGDRQASADFFVDDSGIWKVNDVNAYYTWHVGDGHGTYGIYNRNSIGIEMCVNSDGDFARTLANTILLIRTLIKQYPEAKLVRHYDASRKNCPASLSADNWKEWYKLLDVVKDKTADYKDIIQDKCKFSDPEDVWKYMDKHPYATALYKKWAESYK